MDINKFEEAVKKIGGRFKTLAILHKRLRELIESGVIKERSSLGSNESLEDKILDEIIKGEIYIEENEKKNS